ncbi:hypothetical protein CR513_13932, partial [Mucuna pruriens]
MFNTWGDMKRMFLEKFFSASKIAATRKEICGICQHLGETLHEYWERLLMMDQNMVDVASGGALMDKTSVEHPTDMCPTYRSQRRKGQNALKR